MIKVSASIFRNDEEVKIEVIQKFNLLFANQATGVQ